MSSLINRYILYNEIGNGNFGKVYRSYDTKTNEIVAIKTIVNRRTKLTDLIEYKYFKYVQTNNIPDHPNIVKYLNVFKDLNSFYVVMEYLDGEELFEWVRKSCKGAEPRDFFNIITGIAEGVDHLHRHGICHRDIKIENIMMTTNGRIVLLDLGLCCFVNDPRSYELMSGSRHYASPEVIGNKLTKQSCMASDVWSFGVTIYAVAMGHLPFETEDMEELNHKIESYHPRFYYTRKLNDIQNASYVNELIKITLSKQFFNRPTMSNIIKTLHRIPMDHPINPEKTWYDWIMEIGTDNYNTPTYDLIQLLNKSKRSIKSVEDKWYNRLIKFFRKD